MLRCFVKMGNDYRRLGLEKGRRINRRIVRKFSEIADSRSVLRDSPLRGLIADKGSPNLGRFRRLVHGAGKCTKRDNP